MDTMSSMSIRRQNRKRLKNGFHGFCDWKALKQYLTDIWYPKEGQMDYEKLWKSLRTSLEQDRDSSTKEENRIGSTLSTYTAQVFLDRMSKEEELFMIRGVK